MSLLTQRSEVMSRRARRYLLVATCHFGVIGFTILVFPHLYAGAAFVTLVQYTQLASWGVGYLITAAVCLMAVITRWPSFARIGLIMAFVVLTVSAFAVGWGVVAAWTDGNPDTTASPVVPISWIALAVKDLLMVGQPMRTPLEDPAETAHVHDSP